MATRIRRLLRGLGWNFLRIQKDAPIPQNLRAVASRTRRSTRGVTCHAQIKTPAYRRGLSFFYFLFLIPYPNPYRRRRRENESFFLVSEPRMDDKYLKPHISWGFKYLLLHLKRNLSLWVLPHQSRMNTRFQPPNVFISSTLQTRSRTYP